MKKIKKLLVLMLALSIVITAFNPVSVKADSKNLTDEQKCALGICLLKYKLNNPDSLVVKSITKGTRKFDGEKLTVYYVKYSAQNKAGGNTQALEQIVVRNGKPSDDYDDGEYTYEELTNCLTFSKLKKQFITSGTWTTLSIPGDVKNKKKMNKKNVLKYVEQYEDDDEFDVTD